MKNIFNITLTLFLIFALHNFSYAQDDDPKDFKERIRKVMKEKIMEKLQLDEQTAEEVIELASKNREEITILNKQRLSIYKYFEDNPEAEDTEQKLDELIDIEYKITEHREKLLTDLKKILTSQQIAQALVFQVKFTKFLKEQIEKHKKDGKRKPKRKFDKD